MVLDDFSDIFQDKKHFTVRPFKLKDRREKVMVRKAKKQVYNVNNGKYGIGNEEDVAAAGMTKHGRYLDNFMVSSGYRVHKFC